MDQPPEVDFELAYHTVPPWDIGRPQPAIVSLAAAESIVGPVLDVGCGTGEHVIELAKHGLEVVGVDVSTTAIAKAVAKAEDRGVDVDFRVLDAYELKAIGRRFPTVIDSALLHVIGDPDRYAGQLGMVIEPGGTLIVLEISDKAPFGFPQISEAKIRETFRSPAWTIESLNSTTYETHMGTVPAWIGVVRAAGKT